jgi:hypothetical protein
LRQYENSKNNNMDFHGSESFLKSTGGIGLENKRPIIQPWVSFA